MNCKPGDMAVIVHCDFHLNEGKFVRVLGVGPRSEPGEWLVEPLSVLTVEVMAGDLVEGIEVVGPGASDIYFEDSDLRPIRDPGDDAVDESLSWLPTPVIGFTKETAE